MTFGGVRGSFHWSCLPKSLHVSFLGGLELPMYDRDIRRGDARKDGWTQSVIGLNASLAMRVNFIMQAWIYLGFKATIIVVLVIKSDMSFSA